MKDTLSKLLSKPINELPTTLIDRANSFILQSQVNVKALKPEETAARHFICSQLAVEALGDSLNLPKPNPKALPIPLPPRTYANLLNVFRSALLGLGASPKRSPSKRGRPARAMQNGDTDSHMDIDYGSNSVSGTPSKQRSYSVLNSPVMETPSPQKRGLGYQKEGGGSPSPVKRRGLAKASDPQPYHIVSMCEALHMSEPAAQAVAHAYSYYNNLVKDRWGLLAGAAYTVAKKTQESFLKKTARARILGTIPDLQPDRLDEWIAWANRIIVDQTWIRRITIPSERQANKGRNNKFSSGVGNMITFDVNQRRIANFEAWKAQRLADLEEL